MPRLVVARFVMPAALLAACSATAPLPEQPASAGNGGANDGGRAGATGAKTGGTAGVSAAGAAGIAESSGGKDAGGEAGATAGAAGKAPASGAGGSAGKGQSAGNAGQAMAGAAGNPDTNGGSAGSGGGGDPFGGGGSENGGAGGAEICDGDEIAAGDGLSCTSINYITTGDPCLGCDRGPSLYFCEGSSAPPSPGCSTLPSQGAGYFCCDKSVCTPLPGGCDGAVRYHCPPDATVPAACKKLGGDPTSYCCPK